MNTNIISWLQQYLGLSLEVQGKILSSLLIILVLWLTYRLMLGVIQSSIEELRIRYTWQKVSGYVVVIIGLFLGIQIWLGGLHNLATYLGLLTAGLVIALHDLITDFVGWIYILLSRPFRVGDRIQMGEIAGDVIDLSIFEFSILEIGNWVDADQSTGRVIHIPNGKVFSDPIANYETGFSYIWNEISVNITLDSDWKKAKELLQAIANRHAQNLNDLAEEQVHQASKRFMIYYTNFAPIIYTKVKGNIIVLTMRYLCEPRQRRTSESAICEDILHETVQHQDITFVSGI